MSKIKFRTWDKNSKTMCDVNFIRFSDSQYTNVGYRVKNNGRTSDENSLLDENANGTCVLMQYTGIKDKNGKEIYEGDIIDIHQTVNGCNLFVITWGDVGISARYLIDSEMLREYEYDIKELLDVNIGKYEKSVEVVGNIYEITEVDEI